MCVRLGRGPKYLDQILPLGLGDQRLKLGCCKCIDKTGLGNDQQENLSSGEDREFVCLR
jgi:hypothetical protein